MATSREDISGWFRHGQARGKSHLIVVCDTFDFDDYPVYVDKTQDVHEVAARYDGNSSDRIMEVYKLSDPLEPQLTSYRCFNY